MVQSVKSNLQLFLAVASLTAMVLVTMGNAPPADVTPRKIIPSYLSSANDHCPAPGDISKVWSLTTLIEGRKYLDCGKVHTEARLTAKDRKPN